MDKRYQNADVAFIRIKLLVFVLFSVFSILLLPPQMVGAVSKFANFDKGLTLSPLRSELEIAPGTSLDGVLVVSNSTDKPITVNLSAEAFSVINQQYDYAFNTEADFTKWVIFSPSEVDLTAGESKKVGFNIGVPLTAEPGGRYISLFASTDSKAGEGVTSRQRIASLIYLTVLGDISRVGQLVSLSSPWTIGGDSTWSMALRNSGSTHFRSIYSANVQDLLGHDVGKHTEGDALILPGTVRAVSDKLPAPNLPGIYRVVYTIGLGDTPAKTETRFMLFLPIYAIIVLFSAVGVIAVLLLRRRSKKA